MTKFKMMVLAGALMLLASYSQAQCTLGQGCVDNTTGSDVEVTITYDCNGTTSTLTFTATKAWPTSFSIPSGCCVTSALFEFPSGDSVTLTGVGYDCDGACTCTAWIDQNAGSCENAPSFGIGC